MSYFLYLCLHHKSYFMSLLYHSTQSSFVCQHTYSVLISPLSSLLCFGTVFSPLSLLSSRLQRPSSTVLYSKAFSYLESRTVKIACRDEHRIRLFAYRDEHVEERRKKTVLQRWSFVGLRLRIQRSFRAQRLASPNKVPTPCTMRSF